LWAPAAGAHEIGSTQVSVLLRPDRTYAIDVVTDADALVEKLETLAGRPPASERNALHQQVMLQTLDRTFRQRVTAAFDGVAASPSIEYSVAPRTDAVSPMVATVRLTGHVPDGARTFAWSYGWTFASYALSIRRDPSDDPATEWLEGGQSSAPMALGSPARPRDWAGTARRYLTLGFTHIVPHGLDHVLFVLGLFLLSDRLRSVLWQVSAFTLAHSITLGLSMYGLVTISPSIVEPMIALSIAYVAIENLFLAELRSWRVALVFAFGLLHGLGFAGALSEIGLPRAHFVTALVTFNAGVEAGQLAVIGAAFLAVGAFGTRAWYRRLVVVPASLVIACTAVYWTFQRLL
jgi:hypothetical protein